MVLRSHKLLLLLAAGAILCACYERKDTAILNPDGSGKIFIDVDIAVAPPSKNEPPDVVGTGRLFAANLINSTSGVDAWQDLAITAATDGRAHIKATAFFPDVNKLKLDVRVPIEFTWRRDADGATFSIVRTHTGLQTAATRPTPAQVQELVKKAQDQYKQSQAIFQVQLAAYTQNIAFDMPGQLSDEHLLTRDGSTVSFLLDGKKVAKAVDEIMANEAALTATYNAGTDGKANDEILMQSIFGSKGPISVHVKFPDGAKPLFNYRTEMRVAQLQETEMLKAAGVELVPKFTVKGAATATAPATRP
ncbi:MAG TPA: hypothetical protein VHM90_04765 [Phycisphaerae bacterium]|jgi:hypothetical protein|nr:hypothetical protein [Phycisphaerae bacterium]